MTSPQQSVQLQPVYGQPPVCVTPTAAKHGVAENFASKAGMVSAILQVILGSLCVILDFVHYLKNGLQMVMSHGLICGFLAIIAGGLGIGAAKKKTKSLIVGFMVMSIIVAAAAGTLTVRTSITLYALPNVGLYGPLIVMDIINALMVVCGILSSVLGCKATCCYNQTTQISQATYHCGSTSPVVMVQTSAGQGAFEQMSPPTQGVPTMASTAPPAEKNGLA